ncbi:zinc finger MYM-type protein 1 [Trichonephila clavipes]|nr:zinc finger MYM-type protein 1 [Trichonephila clavipes]
MLVWLTRNENKSVLDEQLQEQLRKDTKYYHNVLKRVIMVLKYLAIRVRGTEEVFGSPRNGNFIGALELPAEFEQFIREQQELRPKSLISYLSKQYMSKIIEIMGSIIVLELSLGESVIDSGPG